MSHIDLPLTCEKRLRCLILTHIQLSESWFTIFVKKRDKRPYRGRGCGDGEYGRDIPASEEDDDSARGLTLMLPAYLNGFVWSPVSGEPITTVGLTMTTFLDPAKVDCDAISFGNPVSDEFARRPT
jgi:hypothetical protein